MVTAEARGSAYTRMESVTRRTAELLGGNIDPVRIKTVIERSIQDETLFHGIKNNSSMSTVRDRGIMPITPESGFMSCWTTGEALFISGAPGTSLDTFNTSLFHYSHSSDPDPDKRYMNLVLTNSRELQKLGPCTYRPNHETALYFTVPPSSLLQLQVEILLRSGAYTSREVGQIGEQNMFGLIEDVVMDGYKLGETRIKKISV